MRLNFALSVALLLSATSGFSQNGQGEFGVLIQCKVIPSKTAIFSSEVLQASCLISRDVGHFYVEVEPRGWDTVGTGRWEIDLKEGDKKELHFAVKLATSPLRTIPETMPLIVRISRIPFGKADFDGWGFSTQITILNYQSLTDSALARRNPAWLRDSKRSLERARRWHEYLKSDGKKGSTDEYWEFNRLQDSIENRSKPTKSDSAGGNSKKGATDGIDTIFSITRPGSTTQNCVRSRDDKQEPWR